jgi:signal peptidase II
MNMTPVTRAKIWPLVLIASLVFALDQWSKWWLLYVFDIPMRAPVSLTENFALVMAWNRGVSFSLFAHEAEFMPYVLVAVAVIISAILVRLYFKSTHRLERIGYAMVVGGAMGNAIDRLRYGAVADFFYAHIGDLGWPAFNVADMAICTGVGLLLWVLVRGSRVTGEQGNGGAG